jgi:hypothetical protein
MIAHGAIDETEVATIVQRVGMIEGQRIEKLGFERALHTFEMGGLQRIPGDIFQSKVARLRLAVQS